MKIPDITYSEVIELKEDINTVIENIELFYKENNLDIDISDISFYRFVIKRVIFFKYLSVVDNENFSIKVIISDFFYLILSLIKNETRYSYVNERSIIENYMRLTLKNPKYNTHITYQSFEDLLQSTPEIGQPEYSLLKTEYDTSCRYIHGGNVLEDSLSAYFKESIEHDIGLSIKQKRERYDRIQAIIKTLDKAFVLHNKKFIDHTFYKKKTIMEFLVGKNNTDLLFL
ncbi:hypothetical protein [Enterococcus durans]|uniref:hypothetical protein n=1 Tax=Enterococcus durans TaxID=53345 RepID=UPI003569277B